ncbi:hypothetical protein GCM10010124_36970 [Pilimelia terevasa]|uniref:Deoxyribonuclease NucA/NucB domain-containing protein n=1 Tax=Pilimelia terevasa TaxID=53372 RepID=A0A8J3BUY9_9ACTN|nr:hypothetical protein GCM10010124_36970 [Pilimelia terevasa]
MWQALNKPLETKPGVPNKVIPGKPGLGQPLTLLVNHTPELDARITKNRTRARENCVRFWGVDYAKPESPNSEYSNQKRDCDEYPMASTFEGVAHADYQPGSTLSFSSNPVPYGENGSAAPWVTGQVTRRRWPARAGTCFEMKRQPRRPSRLAPVAKPNRGGRQAW